jgi:TonB family protein
MSNSDSFEVKTSELPKIYKRAFSDFVDTRYYSTLFSSLALHMLIVVYFLMNPLPIDESGKIARIQAQLAKTLKEREAKAKARTAKFEFASRKPDKPVEEIKPDIKQPPKRKEAKKTSSAKAQKPAPKKTNDREARLAAREQRRARAQARKSSNKDVAASVGSKGLLALLTSSSSIAEGEQVQDILGDANKSNKDLDKALSNLSGISVGGTNQEGDGTGNGTVKGGRTTGGAGIDDLVGGLGEAESSSIERTGDLVVVTGSSSVEGSSTGGLAGRTPEEVQAVVLKHNGSIQYCYERQLKRQPNLKGKVVVRFAITPQGTVKAVEVVSSNLGNKKVEQCMVSRIRRWTDFGPIDHSFGDTTIRQVYAFGY